MFCSCLLRLSGRRSSTAKACSKKLTALVQGGPIGRLGSGLAKVRDRLLPQLAAQGMASQPFAMLDQPVGVEPLDRFHDLPVEGASLLLEADCHKPHRG